MKQEISAETQFALRDMQRNTYSLYVNKFAKENPQLYAQAVKEFSYTHEWAPEVEQ